MRKVGRLVSACILFSALLSGCGQTGIPENVQEPTLAVSKEGQVTACMVGEFDRSYYDLDELKNMAVAEAAAYGGSLGEVAPVRVESVEAADDGSNRVVVTYIFNSTESFQGFTGDYLFYGTVAEALALGYGDGVPLESVKNGSTMTGAEWKQNSDRHLVIYYTTQVEPYQEKGLMIFCPEQVEYVSPGVTVNRDGSVNTTWAEGSEYVPVYLLLKK